MRQDFAEIDESHSLINIPPGEYPCQVVDTRIHSTQDGSPRWGLHWKVLDGPMAGKTAAWDNLIWSERGLPRVKHALTMMGFNTSGVLEVEPHELMGKRALVNVVPTEYEDPHSGQVVRRLSVPYWGYASLPEGMFDLAEDLDPELDGELPGGAGAGADGMGSEETEELEQGPF